MSVASAVAQSCAQPCALGASERWKGLRFPADAILHWDANQWTTELAGFGHDFQSLVLGNQYQLQADGSTVNIGANMPVDTIGGEKWLRSCGAITNLFGGNTSQARPVSLTSGTVYTLHVFGAGTVSCSYGTATVASPLKITATATAAVTFTPSGAISWMLTATAYPVPYVPPGVTQPATNATATNGAWFKLLANSELWKALTGQPLTIATRVRMGVGSGDLPSDGSSRSVTSQSATEAGVQYFGVSLSAEPRITRATDGQKATGPNNAAWARYAIIRRITQVNTAGTQFRVGYAIEGTHTSIQWSAWVNFDSSFNPSTLYRLMLGFNNAYPMWFNKITAWRKQVSDSEIMEALS